MDALLVDGDEIELTPDPPWMWMAPVRLSVTALPGHRIKADRKSTVWESELIQAGLLAAGQMYSAPGFATPGSVITCTLIVNPATMSQVYKDVKLPLATVATSGTFMATMVPAVNPATGVPDPLVAKTGTWKVVTEKQSVATSGQPKPAQLDGDEDDAKAVNAAGDNSAAASANEGKVHWVGVKYQDIDGNPLPEHRIAISTPDGRRVERKTTAAGASRVDGVKGEGEAIVTLLEVNIRPGVKQPPIPLLGVTIVDQDGLPIEGVELGFTSPSGAKLGGVTNTKGTVRLNRLPELGSWSVKALKLPDGLLDGTPPGNGSDTDERSGTRTDGANGSVGNDDAPRKRLFLLEVPDILCRTNSCVILPEGEAPSSSTAHPAVSSVDLFASTLRLCEEHPEFRLLIAAHTDSVDTTKENQVLSEERAQMALAILTGDRDAFRKLAHARHRNSDVKQMLHWCVTAFPDVFSCDPGPIDDKDNLWTPVHTFESEFNYYKHYFQASNTPDLKLTGSMGPNNWGALFDVLQFGIATELGVRVSELADLRNHIRWLDQNHKALGFSEHHPIDGLGQDDYESQTNRRIELLFFKETDLLPDVAAAASDPASSEIYLPEIYSRERIVVPRTAKRITLSMFLQDFRRNVMPHTDYELSTEGHTRANKTNDSGQLVEKVIPGIEYTIRWQRVSTLLSALGDDSVEQLRNGERFTFLYSRKLDLTFDPKVSAPSREEAEKRLANLGYLDASFDKNWSAFERDYALSPSAPLSEPTFSKLVEVHANGLGVGNERDEPKVSNDDPSPDDFEDDADEVNIVIGLVDEQDAPVAGEPYEVLLGDTVLTSGTLDTSGMAVVTIPRTENAEITFPNRDKAAWELA